MIYSLIFIVFILIAFGFQTMQLMPKAKGIRVLMYHKVSNDTADFLTVTTAQLENHLKHLQNLDYQYVTTQQVLDFYYFKKPLPPNPLLLTFDDGYLNNLELAYPNLKKYKAKATLFIPSSFVGKHNAWDNGTDDIMNIEQLQNLDPSVFELALHSHKHTNFKNRTLIEIEEDMLLNIAFFKKNSLPFIPVLAYPYGGRPKGKDYEAMKKMFEKQGILAAFRIGNKVNAFNINDLYALKRIDIRGTDSFEDFKKKMGKGRLRLV